MKLHPHRKNPSTGRCEHCGVLWAEGLDDIVCPAGPSRWLPPDIGVGIVARSACAHVQGREEGSQEGRGQDPSIPTRPRGSGDAGPMTPREGEPQTSWKLRVVQVYDASDLPEPTPRGVPLAADTEYRILATFVWPTFSPERQGVLDGRD